MGQIQRLKEWLLCWDKRHLHPKASGPGGSSRREMNKSGDESKKAALLFGGPGIGKTSSATILCQQLGFDVIEVNASDSRGKSDKDLKAGLNGHTANGVKELVTNRAIAFGLPTSGPAKKTVLLMDEVDGMSGGDRGGVQELIQTIQRSRIPIICICNDKYNQKLKSLVGHCMELGFARPTKQQVSRRLMEIARIEGLQTDVMALELLLENVQCDIRLAINHLQFMRSGKKSMRVDQVAHDTQGGVKDQELSPFTAADKLLSNACKRVPLGDQIDLVFQDADLVPLLVQENYLNFRPPDVWTEEQRMDRILRAADAIAEGDVTTTRVRRSQRWDLMPFACVEAAVAPACFVRGGREVLSPGERNFNRFTAWLGKNSTQSKCTRQLADIHTHTLVSGICSVPRSAIRLDYFSTFARCLTSPLKEKEKEGVDAVIAFMEDYCFTKDDRDALLEINTLTGMADPRAGISSQVKSTFTRLFNQHAAKLTVKSSCLLSDAKAGRKGRGGRAGAGNDEGQTLADNDVIAVDDSAPVLEGGESDDDENDGSEGKGTQEEEGTIPGVLKKRGNGALGARGGESGAGGGRGAGASKGGRGRGRNGEGPATGRGAGSAARGRKK
eukprot:TRINITY_DN8672_c0_g1_i1.p1 TRINITY_DN8672_c0_g1~~TRINITY_DN8672_c0_g1_i1.p1  ORF type:complete len:642 (-),score=151.06 TRINITY_DN8672_c0_g1_i1:634-2475(-)